MEIKNFKKIIDEWNHHITSNNISHDSHHLLTDADVSLSGGHWIHKMVLGNIGWDIVLYQNPFDKLTWRFKLINAKTSTVYATNLIAVTNIRDIHKLIRYGTNIVFEAVHKVRMADAETWAAQNISQYVDATNSTNRTLFKHIGFIKDIRVVSKLGLKDSKIIADAAWDNWVTGKSK